MMRKGTLYFYFSFLLVSLFAMGTAKAQQDADEKKSSSESDLYKQWIDPQRHRLSPIINTLLYDEYAPSISRDGKTLYFQSNREGKGWKSYKLYMSKMNDEGKWGAPEPIQAINEKAAGKMVAGPWISYDNLTLFFCGELEDSKGGMDIYMSTRASEDAEFGEPVNLGDGVNTGDYEGFPSISADGRFLYFSRQASGGDDQSADNQDNEKKAATGKNCYQFYVSKLGADGTWGQATQIESPFTDDCSMAFRVMADNETAYYASLRSGAKKQGNTKGIRADARDFDLFMTRLQEGGQAWDDPKAADFANHLSAENFVSICPNDAPNAVMFFSADMNASQEVFWTLVPPPFAPKSIMRVCATVTDCVTGEPVYVMLKIDNQTRPNLSYEKYNEKEDGSFETIVTEGNKYKVSIEHEDYLPYEFEWDYTDIKSLTGICKDVCLTPKGVDVIVKIIDVLTEEPVDAQLTVQSSDNTSIGDINKAGTGEYTMRIEPKLVYDLTAKASGYYDEMDTLDLTNVNYGAKVTKFIRMLDETAIAFDNINFATARWDLNAAAKTELDKVYKFMTDFPRFRVRIEAHTDYRGSDAYNLRLSQNRAKSAMDYLVAKGIPASRLESEGYGEGRPAVPNEVNGRQNAPNMAINRRVEFKILSK
jgi:outer membrane protein OmpA-like peptidoglycan-associated protein